MGAAEGHDAAGERTAGGTVGAELTSDERRRLSALRRRQRVVLAITAALLVALTGLLVLLRDHDQAARRPSWAVIAILVGFLVVATAAGWWASERRLRRPGPLRRLVLVADRPDIRRVNRLLRRGRPLPEADRPTAQAIVDLQASMRRWNLTSFVLLPVLVILVALAPHGSSFRWVYVVVLLAVIPVYFWTYRKIMTTAATAGITPTAARGVRR